MSFERGFNSQNNRLRTSLVMAEIGTSTTSKGFNIKRPESLVSDGFRDPAMNGRRSRSGSVIGDPGRLDRPTATAAYV